LEHFASSMVLELPLVDSLIAISTIPFN